MKQVEVLLVEDSAADAKLVEITLQRVKSIKYTLEHAWSLKEATRRLTDASYQPDVILLDLTLPGITGIDTYRAIRLSRPGAAVLILTGFFDRDLAVKAVEEGAGGYLPKSSLSPQLLELNIALAIEISRSSSLERQHEEISRRARETQTAELARIPAIIVACSGCGRVKDISLMAGSQPGKQWVRLEDYLEDRGIGLSHTLCPSCMPPVVDQALRKGDA